MRIHRVLVGLAIAASMLVGSVPARASFPGANGRLAFGEVLVDDSGTEYQLYTMNPDGTGQVYLTAGQEPAWSPNGSKIAFRTPTADVYVINADHTGLMQLTNNPAADGNPAWSPDGTKIAFSSGRDGNSEIYVMNADGTNQTRLTNNPAVDSSPAWSPDGTKIAFVTTRDGNEEIYSMNPDGTGQTDLTNDPGHQVEPSWSPDGTKIAYMQRLYAGGIAGQIYVMHRDGSGQSQITSDAADYSNPAWSPDGTKIAAWRAAFYTDPLYAIAVMNTDGTGITTVHGTTADSFGYPLDWQPIPLNYARPRGAGPLLTYLVPAYNACSAPNRTHGSPLAFGSCAPPQQTSSQLTIGTPDANGHAPTTIGSVRYRVAPGDVKIDVNVTGVLTQGSLAPYSGELAADAGLRITDRANTPNPGGPGPGTVEDTSFPVTVPCAAGTCAVATTANAIAPGALVAGNRAIWQLGQVKVYDGDNNLFMVEGVFIP